MGRVETKFNFFSLYNIQNDHTDQTNTMQKAKIKKELMGQRN